MKATSIYTVLAGILLFATTYPSGAQGKYFELIAEKQPGTGNCTGHLVPLKKASTVTLNFKGKSREQLQSALLRYLKANPHFINQTGAQQSFVMFRDFALICNKQQCLADLAALTFVYVIPEDGYLSIQLGVSSRIFANIAGAELTVSTGDIVLSERDVPFNEYNIAQPGDLVLKSSKARRGLAGTLSSQKIQLGLAYPESVFDARGNIIQPGNKKIIEAFFDSYITGLNSFMQQALP